jgi:MFS family permease
MRAPARPRLVLVIGVVMFVDTMLYAVIAPLLPGLAHELRLSKLSAGLLTASYAIGTLAGSLPAGVLVVRAGPRTAVCTGLALLVSSTLAFGLLHNLVALDLARFVEGVGGACSWSGGLAWIAAETPTHRRGAMMGRAMGAAIGGALFGPVVGTVATATGRAATFAALALVGLALIVAVRRIPASHASSGQGLAALAAALVKTDVAVAMWLVTLPAIASGMLNVLGPLRLHRLGAAAGVIGATFLVSAALEAALAPAVGSLSDRRGRLIPLRYGLGAATGALLCFTAPGSVVAMALVIILIVTALSLFWAPAMAMLSDAGEAHGLDQGLAAALINLAWAGGQIIGSGGGGALAKAAGDALPMVITAGLCATTLAALAAARVGGARRGRR